MARYVELDTLVAEINKRIIDAPINYIGHQRVWAYNDVKDIINTLEVKELDFDNEWKKYFEHKGEIATINVKHLAKHFFELGLKAKDLEKEVNTWHLQEKENIYDAVKGWDVQTFACIMKDGTLQKFTGNFDEDCEGHINVHVNGLNDDYDNVDDIVKWIECTLRSVVQDYKENIP